MASEQQLRSLEQRVERIDRDMRTLEEKVKAALQGVRGTYQQPTTSTSGGGGVFFCAPGSSIAAASGVPGTGTPSSISGVSIYQISGGVYSLVTASGSVFNPMLAATTAGHVLAVSLNSDGTYSAISQSCT